MHAVRLFTRDVATALACDCVLYRSVCVGGGGMGGLMLFYRRPVAVRHLADHRHGGVLDQQRGSVWCCARLLRPSPCAAGRRPVVSAPHGVDSLPTRCCSVHLGVLSAPPGCGVHRVCARARPVCAARPAPVYCTSRTAPAHGRPVATRQTGPISAYGGPTRRRTPHDLRHHLLACGSCVRSPRRVCTGRPSPSAVPAAPPPMHAGPAPLPPPPPRSLPTPPPPPALPPAAVTCGQVTDRGFTFAMPWKFTELGLNERDKGLRPPRPGTQVALRGFQLDEARTRPPDYLKESELIDLMDQHGIGTDASIPSHVQNICDRGYVVVCGPGVDGRRGEVIRQHQPWKRGAKNKKPPPRPASRHMVPEPLGLAMLSSFETLDAELCRPEIRAFMESECRRISTGETEKAEVVEANLRRFQAKFRAFRDGMAAVDQYFGARDDGPGGLGRSGSRGRGKGKGKGKGGAPRRSSAGAGGRGAVRGRGRDGGRARTASPPASEWWE